MKWSLRFKVSFQLLWTGIFQMLMLFFDEVFVFFCNYHFVNRKFSIENIDAKKFCNDCKWIFGEFCNRYQKVKFYAMKESPVGAFISIIQIFCLSSTTNYLKYFPLYWSASECVFSKKDHRNENKQHHQKS